MNDKQHDRNRDAGVGNIEGRPGIGISNVQIEKQKIDHMSVEEAISQIAQNPSEKKRKRYVPPRISSLVSHEKGCHDHQCDNGNDNEESVVALERSKGRARIRDIHETKEVRHDDARFIWTDRSQDQLLRQLIESVEREREEEDEFHVEIGPANVQRPTSNA